MKFINLNYLVLLIYLISTNFSYSIDRPEIKNLVIHKNKKKIENAEFINLNGKKLNINKYSENSMIINFWATWCAPCRKEMPSLDKLKSLNEFKKVKIIPINIGGDSNENSKNRTTCLLPPQVLQAYDAIAPPYGVSQADIFRVAFMYGLQKAPYPLGFGFF